MPRTVQPTPEASGSAAVAPPPFEMTDDIKAMIAAQVADGVAAALPAVMQEMQKSLVSVVPNFGNMPSQATTVSLAPPVDVKPKYLKHYRLDDTISGKFQMIDVAKMKANPDLRKGECVIKGRWIHFASDHFYAEDQKEVDFIEHLIEEGRPIYEDKSDASSFVRCPVQGCGRVFGDEDTLKRHLRATHGVDSANA